MNWIIIAAEEKDQNLAKIESFLKEKHNINPERVFITENKSVEGLKTDIKQALNASYCIVCDAQKLDSSKDYAYFMGILAGKQTEVFVYKEDKNASSLRYENDFVTEKGNLVKLYASVQELTEYIDRNYEDLEREAVRREAYKELFTLGIPYNGDAFATYVAKEDEQKCDLFIKAGLSANERNSEGVPMLNIAARSDSMDRLKWLLENGADINAIATDRGYTAVMDAVWRRNFEMTAYLIEKGAKLDTVSSDGQPVMVLAVGIGDEKIVKLLLESGADPELKDTMDMSARQYAMLFKKPEIVKVFEEFDSK